ncbi:hypothetical protein GQ53DRAFT_856499 [Thozetella sp. PMI_491]|nr:hypothetical protein GQ53DRAFT_856499 [Thozetella sp. PMI_491]
MPHHPRQQPGLACEECRRKKLRCDRKQPVCGNCLDAGIMCEVITDRLPRGPRKGTIKALRSQILSLEGRLEGRKDEFDGDQGGMASSRAAECFNITTSELLSAGTVGLRDSASPTSAGDLGRTTSPSIPEPQIQITPLIPRKPFMGELMRADLDQLYFDRVHPIVPILHKPRYFSWAASRGAEAISRSHLCLQSAMWTLAMSMSSQFEHMREATYVETRQMLEQCDAKLDDDDGNSGAEHTSQLEQAQAWILVAHYEFLRARHQRAWFSAGRVFRLVQFLRLHEVDTPLGSLRSGTWPPTKEDNIVMEEKRRAFWVAYSLDRLISVHHELPLALNEEMICTRLPTSEADFERMEGGIPQQTYFLSESLSQHALASFSPLAETAILITLYGRGLAHSRMSSNERLYGCATQDFWSRHEWIDSLLRQRIDSFALTHPSLTVFVDPGVLLSYMIMQATTLYLYKIMEPLLSNGQFADRVTNYRRRAMAAAREISRLTKEYMHISYFKAHIFMPACIFLAAERFTLQRNYQRSGSPGMDRDDLTSVQTGLEVCLEALRKIQSVHHLARHYLNLLEAGDLPDLSPTLAEGLLLQDQDDFSDEWK